MKNKKKFTVVLLVGLLVIALVPMAIFAAGRDVGRGNSQAMSYGMDVDYDVDAYQGIGCDNYVDVDGNGVCDYHHANNGGCDQHSNHYNGHHSDMHDGGTHHGHGGCWQ